jgi:hypothetical protein
VRRSVRDNLCFVAVSLFDLMVLRNVTFPNRTWLAPMCQYSCPERDGVPTEVHPRGMATGGSGRAQRRREAADAGRGRW